MDAIRIRVERNWQAWERNHYCMMRAVGGEKIFRGFTVEQMVETIEQWAARDVDPPLMSPAAVYIREAMGLEGYRHLLAVGSLDGLVEASRQARVCSGAANEVSATVFRVLMEEYGNGKLSRKHSTFYHSMMAQLGLDTRPEAYFDLVPWQVRRDRRLGGALGLCPGEGYGGTGRASTGGRYPGDGNKGGKRSPTSTEASCNVK
ncbi:hypothetical protein Vretimale_3101 [Volvox reticuliferus]|uniref:Uncharacterized protein n=1 Tax=Volvox reticuliferus TaxID=1737510 RepID=A0A8J4FZY8_9CHLO|nr:hypothetical protein Vretimale_3101 [Volvox reticuliferus]